MTRRAEAAPTAPASIRSAARARPASAGSASRKRISVSRAQAAKARSARSSPMKRATRALRSPTEAPAEAPRPSIQSGPSRSTKARAWTRSIRRGVPSFDTAMKTARFSARLRKTPAA
ncbi:hypothetical protein D3C85_880440 [compost metagenome]